MCVEPIPSGGKASTGLVDPMARSKRQLYKGTPQGSRVRVKTKARVRFAINSCKLAVRGLCTWGQDFSLEFSMLWPVKIFRSKESKTYFLLGIVNDILKVTLNLQ